jgi:hypothetical protein
VTSPDQALPYATPMAFRRALTDKLRAIALPNGPWPLPDLQRQFAYDRLLTRLYVGDGGWILKGATALLARGIAVRHTVDVDVYRAVSQDRAERDLRSAIAVDIGDWFEFQTGASQPIADGANGVRIPITARLGMAPWAQFHIDVVADGVQMTGRPDDVRPLTAVAIPGLVGATFKVYPLVDHIADKTCAILERHGPAQRPSTRFKDLVDLVVLIHHVRTRAEDQRRALASEASRRNISLPERFEVPDQALWEKGYRAEARRTSIPVVPSLSVALAQVGPFLDPLLAGAVIGDWDAKRERWSRDR